MGHFYACLLVLGRFTSMGGTYHTTFVQQLPFYGEELSFRYAGASADAPAYHFYREGFCSNRSVMLRRLIPRVERLCSMALVAGGRMPRAPRRMRAELKLSTKR